MRRVLSSRRASFRGERLAFSTMNDGDAGPWVVVATSRDHDGNRSPGDPREAYLDWLRANGIDGNPFATDEVRIDHYRIALPDGGAGCNWVYRVRAAALRRLGIKPP
jgi:hypothetical protein